MLEAKEYKQYNSECSKRLRVPKFYLSRWGYYERNARKLNLWERKRAKTLYKILGNFTKEERMFLANKYRSESYKSDEVASKEHEMEQKQYSKLRIGMELKFFHHFQQEEGV